MSDKHAERHSAPVIVIPSAAPHGKRQVRSFSPRGKGGRRRAVDRARHQKPEIPRVGDYGIPLHDEIDLSLQIR